MTNKKSGLADSPFFSAPDQEHPLVPENRMPERNSVGTEIRTVFRSENRTDDLPIKRRTKRFSFEFYDDQLMKLKHLKYQAELEGKSISQSDIVRKALDDYLQNK